jgi:translation initiation factor 2 subunit 2
MTEKNKTENYEEMLNEAYANIKPIESHIERFEIPKAEGHIEGIRTIITNFKQICAYMRRDCNHVLKFLLRELATPGVMKADRLVLTRKISSSQVNEKIKLYADTYVICRECKKPDTEILKQDRFNFIHCLACGAKKSIAKI